MLRAQKERCMAENNVLEVCEEEDTQIWMHLRRKLLPQEKDHHPKTLRYQLKIKTTSSIKLAMNASKGEGEDEVFGSVWRIGI